MKNLAIIGGTGLTQMVGLEVLRREVVETPFGPPSAAITVGKLWGQTLHFLPRHGDDHHLPPHKINYRANIWALAALGIKNIIAFAAVGGITPEASPEKIVLPDQIIDYSYGREQTFFDGEAMGVSHIDFSQPYCPFLRKGLLAAACAAKVDFMGSGTYGVTQGPRLETAAEINKLEKDGCDIVGMTAMPEAALAKEQGLGYATLAIVVNPAAGRTTEMITLDTIRTTLAAGMVSGVSVLEAFLSHSIQQDQRDL
ncbi:MAG TPA: S-methyl-5'-thioinosine phosphorylase [Gammaproteobacteria bacterium]|nr:S-methyl-5'-thioinosine phosphorylase [Gammaproteobacteria bacterium]